MALRTTNLSKFDFYDPVGFIEAGKTRKRFK